MDIKLEDFDFGDWDACFYQKCFDEETFNNASWDFELRNANYPIHAEWNKDLNIVIGYKKVVKTEPNFEVDRIKNKFQNNSGKRINKYKRKNILGE